MSSIQFGILTLPYQALDIVGPLDILSTCSKRELRSVAQKVDRIQPSIIDCAIDIEFHHIGNTMDPVMTSAGIKICPTTTSENCPPLDYLLVGGPDPTKNHLTPAFTKLLHDHVAAGKVLFTTCTGALVIAGSGLLDGKDATTNHDFLDFAKANFPKVNWKKEQWVIDNGIWTAGGACAGMDMMAYWVSQNYDAKIARIGLELLDFEPRDIHKKMISG